MTKILNEKISLTKVLLWAVPTLLSILIAVLSWIGTMMKGEWDDTKSYRKKQDSAWIKNDQVHMRIMNTLGAVDLKYEAHRSRLFLYKEEVLVPLREKVNENGVSIIELQKAEIEQDHRLKTLEKKTGVY